MQIDVEENTAALFELEGLDLSNTTDDKSGESPSVKDTSRSLSPVYLFD